MGDNTTVNFNIPIAVNSSNSIFVFVDSILQEPDVSYSTAANVITFTQAPESNSNILIKYFDQSGIVEKRYFVSKPTIQSYSANGNQNSFSFISNIASTSQALVFVDGVIQEPNVNYTQSGNVITFDSNLSQNSKLIIRHFDTTDIEVSTANIAESGNLYFTNTRAISALTAGQNLVINSNGLITVSMTSINSNLVPTLNETYDLGSSSNKWKDLYLSGNTIILGSLALKNVNGTLVTAQVSANGYVVPSVTIVGSGFNNVTSFNVSNVLTTSNTISLGFFAERTNIISTAFSTTNQYNINDGVVHYHTSNASANGNVVLNGFVSVPVGNTVSMAVLVTNGANAFRVSRVLVDGQSSNVTVRWSGGVAPTSGNASNIDVYSFNVIKTSSNSYTVLASQSNFG